MIGGEYDTTSQPDWSIVTRANGIFEFRVDMFLPSNGNLPYFDDLLSFFEFVDPSDTCEVNCDWWAMRSVDGRDAWCRGYLSNIAPDDIFGIDYFDGGTTRYKPRSTM